MKKCFKCNEAKELSEFYPHKMMADGRLNKCKLCAKKDSDVNFKRKMTDPDWMEKERKRQRIKEAKKRHIARQNAPLKIKKPAMTKDERRERYAGYWNAIRDGKLIQMPCVVCGKQKSQGHHEDYSKPLDVVWLCARHHADRHMHLRNAKKAGQEPMPINYFIKSLQVTL